MKIRIQTLPPMVSDTSQHSTPGSDREKQPHFPSSPHPRNQSLTVIGTGSQNAGD